MKRKMECPYCDGQAEIRKETKDLTFRKEDFKVVQHYYKCNKCEEEFTTNEADSVTLVQAHNQYRERHGIPFIEDIVSVRENYQLSATKMSEVLGLGVNAFSNYEKGEIPSEAIGNLINSAADPKVFLKLLDKNKHHFSDSAYLKARERVELLIAHEILADPFYCKLNQYLEPSNYTGYKKLNNEKIGNVLVAFINACNNQFNDRIKLNKLLFYSDFCHYKLHGFSITGLTYRAIKYGPVPTYYDNIFTFFENEGIICSDWDKDTYGGAKETFETDNKIDAKCFTENELHVIECISEKFKNIPSWELVDLSHQEKAWQDLHSVRGIIGYQDYAFELKDLP